MYHLPILAIFSTEDIFQVVCLLVKETTPDLSIAFACISAWWPACQCKVRAGKPRKYQEKKYYVSVDIYNTSRIAQTVFCVCFTGFQTATWPSHVSHLRERDLGLHLCDSVCVSVLPQLADGLLSHCK